MSLPKVTYLGAMKTLRLVALLPLLLGGAAACDDFGLATDPNKEQGELRWTLDQSAFTKADAEIPDTNDFLLTITDARGEVLYDGTYGDSPEYLKVDPGSYTVRVQSIAFTAPDDASSREEIARVMDSVRYSEEMADPANSFASEGGGN